LRRAGNGDVEAEIGEGERLIVLIEMQRREAKCCGKYLK